ncbi:MAG: rRNA maturation RNase YbeY [Chloroherpetonaceae bacterium]|nr:rRNA maturation RNase YbeY [Chloroherpetonaceae bacterium]MDW8438286.1 rRNA maturation RNase YbeY [Chloroherpetonaceae bacterium]
MILIFNTTKRKLPAKKLRQAIELVLKGEKRRAEMISAVYCGDKFIKKINRAFLRHDYATDTISFPLSDGKRIEGEFYVSLDTVARNARRYEASQTEELLRVTIHSVLHLVGYDDQTPAQKKRMTAKENAYLKKISRRRR